MEINTVFNGFMPVIHNIDISEKLAMMNDAGDLVDAHIFSIENSSGTENTFSISDYDLMRLFFLIGKILHNK